MTTRQRMIDVLAEIAEDDAATGQLRADAAFAVLVCIDGDEDEQAPVDEFPRTVTFGDAEFPVADPFPWLANAPAGGVNNTVSALDLFDELTRQSAERCSGLLPPKPAPRVEVSADFPCGGKNADILSGGIRYTVRIDGEFVGSFCNCSRELNPHLSPESEYIKQTIEAVIRSVTS